MTDREGGQRRLEEEGCPESTDAKGWGGSRTDVEARVGSPEDRVYVISRIVRECQSCARHRLAAALAVHRARGLAIGDEPHERPGDEREATTLYAFRRAFPRAGLRPFAVHARESLAGGDDAAQGPRIRRAVHFPRGEGMSEPEAVGLICDVSSRVARVQVRRVT